MNLIKLWISRRKIGFFSLSRRSQIVARAKVHSFVILKDVYIGDMSYVANFSRISNTVIGKFTSIGSDVRIGLGIHPDNWVSSHPAFYSLGKHTQKNFTNRTRFNESKQICIGNDVWIGQGVIIMDGVTIHNGAVVGAGAVVTRDIPPFAVAVGVPAKVIRYRFQSEDIAFLQLLKWWDKDDVWLEEHSRFFHSIDLLRANC